MIDVNVAQAFCAQATEASVPAGKVGDEARAKWGLDTITASIQRARQHN